MSLNEPAVWTRTHSVWVNEKEVKRVAGERVGGLMRTWRELRIDNPVLFNSRVRVWGSEATMDEQICGFLTETDMEDAEKYGATQSFVQVDLVGCEHTEFSLDQKFLHN